MYLRHIPPWSVQWGVISVALPVYAFLLLTWLENGPVQPLLGGFVFTCVILYNLWQGRRWARRIFGVLTITALPFVLIWLGSLFLFPPKSLEYTLILKIWLLGSMYLAELFFYLKPSRRWFRIDRNQDRCSEPSAWDMQFALILLAIGLGSFALSLVGRINLMPFAIHYSEHMHDYAGKLIVIISFQAISYLLAASLILFPFAFVIGLWRRCGLYRSSAALTFGAFLPVIYFNLLNEQSNLVVLSMLSVCYLIITAIVVYSALYLGTQTAAVVKSYREDAN